MFLPQLAEAGYRIFMLDEEGWLARSSIRFRSLVEDGWRKTSAFRSIKEEDQNGFLAQKFHWSGLGDLSKPELIVDQTQKWMESRHIALTFADLGNGRGFFGNQEMSIRAAAIAKAKLGLAALDNPFYTALGRTGTRERMEFPPNRLLQQPDFTSISRHALKPRIPASVSEVAESSEPPAGAVSLGQPDGAGPGASSNGKKPSDDFALEDIRWRSKNFTEPVAVKIWPAGDGYGLFVVRKAEDAERVLDFLRHRFLPHKGVPPQQILVEKWQGIGRNYSLWCETEADGKVKVVAWGEKLTREIEGPLKGIMTGQEYGRVIHPGSTCPPQLAQMAQEVARRKNFKGVFHIDAWSPQDRSPIGSKVGAVMFGEDGDRVPGSGVAQEVQEDYGFNLYLRNFNSRGVEVPNPEPLGDNSLVAGYRRARINYWTPTEREQILAAAADNPNLFATFDKPSDVLSDEELAKMSPAMRPDSAFDPAGRIVVTGTIDEISRFMTNARDRINALDPSLTFNWPEAYDRISPENMSHVHPLGDGRALELDFKTAGDLQL